MPGYFRIEQDTFVDLENLIVELETAGKRIKPAMNDLCKVLAFVGLAQAQKRSRGIVDPRQTSSTVTVRPGTSRVGYTPGRSLSSQAWKIPVRRITGAYYRGWRVNRVTMGVWEVFNESREAYFIEYGIHTSGRRVRRPIAKLSLLATIRFADPIIHRMTNWVFPWGRYSVQSPAMSMGIHPATSGTARTGTSMHEGGGYAF
jgi:hypothetical protein